jgi:8-oxo-dGTP diphosphatase
MCISFQNLSKYNSIIKFSVHKFMETLESYLETAPGNIKKSVVCYAVKENKVLLGLRKRVSFGLGDQLLAGIGGKYEAGETTEQAFMREWIEEVGTDSEGNVVCEPVSWRNHGKVTFIFPHQPEWSMEVDIFVVTEWKGEPVETKPVKPEWHDINDLPVSQMWEDNPRWVPHVLAGKRIEAAYLYGPDDKIIEEIINILED